MEKFFMINENFNQIINNTLKREFNFCIVENLVPISTGWTNIVYKVETNHGNYFFRFPRDEFWERTIVKDCQFANFIKSKTSFKTSDIHLGYDNSRPFSYHKEIPGKPLSDVMNSLSQNEIDKISFQICKFMNELHHIQFDKSQIFSIDNIGLNLNDFISELLDEHVSEDDKSFWKLYNFDGSNNCLVHGDFNSSNILLDDNNNVVAVIDFGFGGFGNKYMDISRIIGRCPNNFKNSIISSYEKIDNHFLDINLLDNDIEIWNNIDSGYINYMKKIGIYE